jgi:hypothetical protein
VKLHDGAGGSAIGALRIRLLQVRDEKQEGEAALSPWHIHYDIPLQFTHRL